MGAVVDAVLADQIRRGDFEIRFTPAPPTPNDHDPAGRTLAFLERFKMSKHWDNTGHDERCPWAWDYMDSWRDMNGHGSYAFPNPAPPCHCERLEAEDDDKAMHAGS